MTYLLDANTWINWLRQNNPNVVARIKKANPADLVLCSVVFGELIYGAERSGAAQRPGNLIRVRQLRARYPTASFDDTAAEQYGRIRADLSYQGLPIGPNDTMIAAIALASRWTVVTNNTREFNRVRGLIVEDWQSP